MQAELFRIGRVVGRLVGLDPDSAAVARPPLRKLRRDTRASTTSWKVRLLELLLTLSLSLMTASFVGQNLSVLYRRYVVVVRRTDELSINAMLRSDCSGDRFTLRSKAALDLLVISMIVEIWN